MISGRLAKKGNRWYIILELRDPVTGARKPKWIATGCTKKRDAEAKLHDVLAQYNRGTYVEPSTMTVEELLRSWVTGVAPLTASARTCAGYRAVIEHHLVPAMGAVRLPDLTPEFIQSYYTRALASGRVRVIRKKKDGQWITKTDRTGEPLSSTSVRQHHIVLRRALKQAVSWRKLTYNPTDDVVAPEARGGMIEAWTQHEARAFLKQADKRESRFLDLYILALGTGMRQAELLGLRWSDIDFPSGTISVQQTLEKPGIRPVFKVEPKSKKSRRALNVSPSIIARLTALRAAQISEASDAHRDFGLVFAQKTGLPYDPSNMVNRDFNSVVASLSDVKRITFHGLRHTHATDLMRRGINPKVISERLGHASVSFTMDIYGHLLPGMQSEAAAAIDDLLPGDENE